MPTKPTPGRWRAEDASGTPGRYVVLRTVGSGNELLRSPSGRRSVFSSYRAAADKASRLNKDEAIEAELRTEYASQPALPALTLGRAVAKAIGCN